MPRPRKPARVLYHASEDEWRIHDGPLRPRTGVRGAGSLSAAERALADYLSQREISSEPTPLRPSIGWLLAFYADARSHVRGVETLAYCIDALGAYWGDLRPDQISAEKCREYERQRAVPRMTKAGMKGAGRAKVRRELGVLRAAMNFAVLEGKIPSYGPIALPAVPPAKTRWLTRSEVAAIAWCGPRHLRRFILLSVYTGRRASAVLGLKWRRGEGGGYVDVARGFIDFEDPTMPRTNKRRGAVFVPEELLRHLRRWQHDGEPGPIAWRGALIAEIDTAFEAAVRRAAVRYRLDLSDVTPHTLKHTAVSWFFQAGGGLDDGAEYFATTARTLEEVYKQHSPEYQARARRFVGRAGRSNTVRNSRF